MPDCLFDLDAPPTRHAERRPRKRKPRQLSLFGCIDVGPALDIGALRMTTDTRATTVEQVTSTVFIAHRSDVPF